MIGRRALLGGLLASAGTATAQTFRVGRAPGFQAGLKFLIGKVASFIQPYNTLIAYGPGDSRTAQGGSLQGAYGSGAGVSNNSYASTSGDGLESYLPAQMGHIVRFQPLPNPGIGGQTGAQALAYPRPLGPPSATWTGRIDSGTAGTAGNTLTVTAIGGGDQLSVGVQITGTGITPCVITALGTGTGGTGTYTVNGSAQNVASTNTIQPNYLYGHVNAKTIADVAAAAPAIVILWVGTNSSGAPADLTAVDAAVNGLTNPSYVHPGYGAALPLYNGQPKTIILLTDTRRGITTTNTVNQQLSAANAAQFANYASQLKRYSFDSGTSYANPHVVVVDTFNDPTLANLSDTTTYNPNPGFFADGLHPASPGVLAIGKIIAARVLPLLTATATYNPLPTTDTAANYVSSNPCFTTTSGGAASIGTSTISSGAVPSGWRLLSVGGLTFAISYNALGGNLGNEMVLHITGTPAASGTIQVDQLLSTAQKANINLASDTIRAVANIKSVISTGQPVIANLYGNIQAGSASNAMTTAVGGTGNTVGYSNNSAFSLLQSNGFASTSFSSYLPIATKNLGLSAYGATGNPSQVEIGWQYSVVSGTAVDITLTISQAGVAKVNS